MVIYKKRLEFNLFRKPYVIITISRRARVNQRFFTFILFLNPIWTPNCSGHSNLDFQLP